ncbi:MAG TPA: DinB family protein [Terriglobales bacterium]|nr:DinB family protein [Terriglobales bacterium]
MLNETVSNGIAARYEELGAKVQELARPLNDEQFWTKPFAFGNSFGHLVLHLTGNLNYYIGAEIAGTGYVRDRPREFTESERQPKSEVLKRLADAIAMVARTARTQKDEDWSKFYKAEGEHDAGNRFAAFLRCATHFHLHIGQMIYLQFALLRK